MQSFRDVQKRIEVENDMEYAKWIREIPRIPVKEGWKVTHLPSSGGTVARLKVELPDGRVKSIFLDCYENLGFFYEDQPYWEVYPAGDDIGRCAIDDIERLIILIEAGGTL